MPPTIWGPHNRLLPENLKLFRRCVRSAAEHMVKTGVIDFEHMAYYDDHVHNVGITTSQEVDDELFTWNVIRYHKYLVGRVGPEWGVVTRCPWEEVAFKTTKETKMKDFKKKVLPYILEHPDVQKVYYVKMRIISQWRNYTLPRLIS